MRRKTEFVLGPHCRIADLLEITAASDMWFMVSEGISYELTYFPFCAFQLGCEKGGAKSTIPARVRIHVQMSRKVRQFAQWQDGRRKSKIELEPKFLGSKSRVFSMP